MMEKSPIFLRRFSILINGLTKNLNMGVVWRNFHSVAMDTQKCIGKSFPKNEKFREINYFVTYLVKMLLSRNFVSKIIRMNFHNFHTTLHTEWKLLSVSHSFLAKIS